jgi:uncharacterized cupredoxin-like copper-binding protein
MHTAIKKNAVVFSLLLIVVLVLTACSGSGSGGGATTVTVTLTDFKIDSSLTTFQTGVAYHFVVTNKGAVAHQFVIIPPETNPSSDQVKSAMVAGIEGDGVAVGATQSFDYTFKDASPAGKLEMACHLPGHYDAGMHTPITVQ